MGLIILENSTTLTALEQPRDPKKRFDAVDIAKGILILAVVFSHAWFANTDILGSAFPYSMPAFFFLSGYTYKPGRGYGRNMGKRVLQLVVPYVLFSIVCNLLYPVYLSLSKTAMFADYPALWIATLKGDALNMLMGTPMWFLTALFTGSVIFFAVADITRNSLWKTIVASAVLVAITVVIEIFKKENFVWHIDYAPFGAAMMLIGTYCGSKKLFSKLTVKSIIIGIVCLAAAAVLNRFFPGSGKTSVVQYIEGDAWYGVITAFAIAVFGSLGILCFSAVVDLVPAVRKFFIWLGQNSLWILCIHYTAIMLIELQLFNMKILSNSIMQVVATALFGYGKVSDTPKDIIVKILVALVSVGISAIYAVIHKSVKQGIKSAKARKAASAE